MKPKKISPIFVYYRVALQRDFLLGYLSCRVQIFPAVSMVSKHSKSWYQNFSFSFYFFFVRWSVSSIISGYVKSVPVWLRIFSRFCKWVPQAPIQSSVDVLNSVLLWEFSFPGTLRETSFVSWALASLVEIEANKSGAVVDFTPSLYM